MYVCIYVCIDERRCHFAFKMRLLVYICMRACMYVCMYVYVFRVI